jgi:hypothetical protein
MNIGPDIGAVDVAVALCDVPWRNALFGAAPGGRRSRIRPVEDRHAAIVPQLLLPRASDPPVPSTEGDTATQRQGPGEPAHGKITIIIQPNVQLVGVDLPDIQVGSAV